MRMSKAIFVCVCLVGLTQLVWSQNKDIGAFQQKGIPGYLNPRTGTFTTRTQGSAVTPGGDGQFPGTAIFFREQANITIQNFDQPTNALAVCHVDISSSTEFGWFDSADVSATSTANGWTCNVPVLTLWTLVTPNTDKLTLCVSVDILQVFTLGSVSQAVSARTSSQPCLSLSQPANAQTVVNTFTFQL
jgi:hypothetical protein